MRPFWQAAPTGRSPLTASGHGQGVSRRCLVPAVGGVHKQAARMPQLCPLLVPDQVSGAGYVDVGQLRLQWVKAAQAVSVTRLVVLDLFKTITKVSCPAAWVCAA